MICMSLYMMCIMIFVGHRNSMSDLYMYGQHESSLNRTWHGGKLSTYSIYSS